MTTFETIEKHETEFGNNNFVQVARKIAKGEEDDTSTEFISLTRGYLDAQGSRRYKTNLSLPPEPELLGFVKDAIEDV
jgi:hypothetical protein